MRNRIISKFTTVLIGVCFLFGSVTFSQTPAGCDLKFVSHLVRIGSFNEALHLLDSSDCLLSQSSDSVNYLKGWSLYSLQRLRPSSQYLLKVSESSGLYFKSRYFAAYNYTHSGDYDKALETLLTVCGKSVGYLSLNSFEKAGIYLLKGDTASYRESFLKTNSNLYGISQSYDNLQKIADDLRFHKTKSPVLSGMLSGLIPGSGKFYCGKKGEAISAFIATTGLGLVTFENYRKNGLKNFSTIAFGSAFLLTYVSNVYGTVLSARIVEIEYQNNVKNTILFNLHIPLRNTFE